MVERCVRDAEVVGSNPVASISVAGAPEMLIFQQFRLFFCPCEGSSEGPFYVRFCAVFNLCSTFFPFTPIINDGLSVIYNSCKKIKAQSVVKYLNVWYRALNIYKAELKQAKNTEEAAAVQKRYNCFKWTLPELATDSDATKLQMKILSDAISELRKQLDLDMSSSQDTEENSASFVFL